MKIMHLADLHLGKRVNGFSMNEDQKFILGEILRVADAEKPDACVIAGDVYDKPVPSVEAVRLLDRFLQELAGRKIHVFLVSGNHDSPERLEFLSGLVADRGIHITSIYRENSCFTLKDDYGNVVFHMLPFVKPAQMRALYPDDGIETYTDAVRAAVSRMHAAPEDRNVIVAHQCVLGSTGSGSEDIMIGGSDNIDASVFRDFDYAALGHLHRPQDIKDSPVRYCGTPLKYSFSEADDTKSVTIAVLGEKGQTGIHTVPLRPMRDMAEIKGSFEELTDPVFYLENGGSLRSCYLHVTLTDRTEVLDAVSRLRVVYPYLMKVDYECAGTDRSRGSGEHAGRGKTAEELFRDFFLEQNGEEMTGAQEEYMKSYFSGMEETE